MYYVYILECSDSSLYTGITNDLDKRLKAHGQGRGAKYTRGRGPVTLRYLEILSSKEEALRREAAIKKLSKKQKMKLINDGADSENIV